MNINFHERLAYLSHASDDNELINRIFDKPDIFLNPVGDSELAKQTEEKIQDFLNQNKSKLNQSDAPALKDLQGLVHMLEVRSGLQQENNNKPSTLEKTISVCIAKITPKTKKPPKILVSQPTPATQTTPMSLDVKIPSLVTHEDTSDYHSLFQKLSAFGNKYYVSIPTVLNKKAALVRNLFVLGTYYVRGKDFSDLLLYHTKADNPEMVELLKTYGADVNKVNASHDSPLMWAELLINPKMQQLLKKLGADWNYSEEANRRTFLAHLWGLNETTTLIDQAGTSHVIQLEGIVREYALHKLSFYVNDFFEQMNLATSKASKDDLPVVSKENQIKIQSAIANSFPLALDSPIFGDTPFTTAANMIKAGEPFVILDGTIHHAVSLVLFNDQLVVFNRGAGRKEDAAEFYSLPSANVNRDLLMQLSTIYPNMTEFNKMISDLKLTKLGGFPQKSQKVGNCAWASSKGALEILFMLYTDQETGRKLYKEFTLFSRKRGLDLYLKEANPIDIEILNRIKRKCAKKSKSLSLVVAKKIKTRFHPKTKRGGRKRR